MILLTNRDLKQLRVKKRAGIRFETDLLDVRRELFEVVSVSSSGVLVKKIALSVPEGPVF